MAIQFTQASDRVHYTGALPAPGAGFTLCAWVKPAADPDTWQSIVRMALGGSSAAILATDATGTAVAYVTPTGTATSGFNLAAGQWAFVAIRGAAGAGTAIGSVPGGALVAGSAAVLNAGAPDMITIGGRSDADATEPFLGAVAHVRLATTLLTDAELLAERRSTVPLHPTIVGAGGSWWPLADATDLADQISGRNLVAGTTAAATTTGPPIGAVSAAVALGASGSGGKLAVGAPSTPLALSAVAVDGDKHASGLAAAALPAGASAAGTKQATGIGAAPLGIGASATGQAVEGGVPSAFTSEVLCAPWATVSDIPADRRPLVSDDEWAVLLTVASEELWALSGEQWRGAGCSATAVLSGLPTAGTGSWPYGPGRCCWAPADGTAWSWDSSYRPAEFAPYAVLLPHTEVTGVTSVLVDGVAFDAWRLEGSWLERTDGHSWSTCGTLRVTYTYGFPPPSGAVRSAVVLAVEMALATADPGACRLPKATSTVTRQGVSITLPGRGELLDKGRTGLPSVDRWLRTVNPRGRPREADVWSPDLPRMTSSP